MPIRPQQGGVPGVAKSLPIVGNFSSDSYKFLDDGFDHETTLRAPAFLSIASKPYAASLLTVLGTAAVLLTVAPVPFSQDDWPVFNRRNPVVDQLGFVSSSNQLDDIPSSSAPLYFPNKEDESFWQRQNNYNLALLTTSSLTTPPFSQDDWPTTTRSRIIPDQVGFVSSSKWIAPPFYQGDWPNPQRQKANTLDQLSCNINLLSVSFGPFTQSDWTNPRGARYAHAGFVSSSSWLAAPFTQSDWQNPVRARPSSVNYFGHIETYKINLYQLVFIPFAQGDWPNPVRAQRPLIGDQLGYIDPSETWLLKDSFFGPAGMGPTYDWPNPQRAKPRSEYGSTDSYKVLLFAAPPSPFYVTDWQNPKGPRALVGDQLGYVDASEFWMLKHVLPVASQSDWTNPQRLRTIGYLDRPTYNLNLFSVTFAPPFYQTDWSNPQRSRTIGYLDRSYNLNLFSVTFAPFRQIDWPVPKARASGHFGFVDSYRISLRQVPFVQTDWPNPSRGALRTNSHYGHLDFYKINLLNPLNQPTKQTDWPNPSLGQLRNIGNHGWREKAQILPGNFQIPDTGQLLLTTYEPTIALVSAHHWRQTISLRGNFDIKDDFSGSMNEQNLKGNRLTENDVRGDVDNEEDLLGNIDNKRDLEGE